MEGKERHPSIADAVKLPTLADFERRRQREGSNKNDLVVEIPVALLDIFERETVVPLTRTKTYAHSDTAALRIRERGRESRSWSLSSLVADGDPGEATLCERNNSHLGQLPKFPPKAHVSPPRPIQRSGSPSSSISSPQVSPEVYKQLGNFSFISSETNPSGSTFSDDGISVIPDAANPSQGRGTIASMIQEPADRLRKSSIHGIWEAAKKKQAKLERSKWAMLSFEYGVYILLLLFIYFVLVGRPLWKGLTWYLWLLVARKFALTAGVVIFLGTAFFYAFGPLLIFFEKDPAEGDIELRDVQDTALIIPCYKSAGIIEATLEAAKKIFPPEHIFVIANGNSPNPLDNTEDICKKHGVHHVWIPVGSKIVAQFAGCYVSRAFKYVLLIDDDCALPANFPVVTNWMTDKIKCIGYTIKSVGPNSSTGTIVQQAQDLEYKMSGLQREFAGKLGSATFPHGAISIWDRQFLTEAFKYHPGFSVSEDWFLGHVARIRGSRIKMCSQVFVETETPSNIFIGSGSRGGFGEMTVWTQRFHRWNFFFVSGIWYDMGYILGSWKLGWWEFGTKLFVWQEVYETILYLLTPFILPISFLVRPFFALWTFLGVIALYAAHAVIFNGIHLRRKNEMVPWMAVLYYVPYKVILTFINVTSCYWAIFKYAQYFAKRHPKVIEDEKSVEVVVRISESQIFDSRPQSGLNEKSRPQNEMSRPQSMWNEKRVLDAASVYP